MRNYYILIVSVIFICGILLASFGVFASLPLVCLAGFIIVLFVFLAVSLKNNFLFTAFFSLLVFLLGVIRYNAFNIMDKNHIKNYTSYSQEQVLLQGRVVSDPNQDRLGEKQTFILEASAISSEKNHWRGVNGLVLVNLYQEGLPAFRYGDILALQGALKRPFSYSKRTKFDYARNLADKRIYSILNVKPTLGSTDGAAEKIGEDKRIVTKARQIIYSIRSKLESQIETFLETPSSSVLAAILLGKRQKISAALTNLFAKTGTLHILAISGLHTGIIYFALRVILKIFRVRKNLSIILSILFLACFAILTGARASILRATIMFSILGLGEILKRRIGIYNLIGLSSLIILIVNPNQIFNVGFTLSYAALLSIVYISPIIYGLFSASGPFKYYLLRSISVSVAAWVGLLPLIAYYFGLISPVVVIANLIVIPLLLMLMGCGILLLTVGFLSEFLAHLFAQSAWFFAFILIRATMFLKNVPFSYFEIPNPRVYHILFYYLLLLIAAQLLKTKKLLFHGSV